MLSRDKSISAWQTGIITFVLMFANKILLLPSILSSKSKIEAILIIAISFVFEFALVVLFYFAKKKFVNKNIFKCAKTKFGRCFSIFLAFLCAIFFLSKAVLLFGNFEYFLRSVMYKDASKLVFLVCFLPVASFLAYSGVRTMGRTMQLFFPLVVLILTFCIFVGLFNFDGGTILNIVEKKHIIHTFFTHISAFGDSLFLFVVLDRVDVNKKNCKAFFTLTFLGIVFVCLICFVYFFSYQNTVNLYPFAFLELLSFVKEYEGLGRIDIVAVILLMFIYYFIFSIYVKGFVDSICNLGEIFNEKKSILLFNLFFVFITIFFIKNAENTLILGEKIIPFLEIIPFILLPCLIFFAKKEDK